MALSRIARRMWSSSSCFYAVRADRLGNRDYRADVHHRDSVGFDRFDHRCTATSAGSSSGGEDHGVDSVFLELRAYRKSEFLRVRRGGSVSDGRREVAVEFLEDAFLLHLAEHVDGEDAVRVGVGVGGVISAVGRRVVLGVDRLYALDAVGSELRGAGGLGSASDIRSRTPRP